MRLLVDECAGPVVASWLRSQGHDVFSVYEQDRGTDDDAVLARAFAEDRVLVTADKDFGDKVYREKRPHRGIVLLRLEDERAANMIRVLQRLMEGYQDQLSGRFVVVTEHAVRFARVES